MHLRTYLLMTTALWLALDASEAAAVSLPRDDTAALRSTIQARIDVAFAPAIGSLGAPPTLVQFPPGFPNFPNFPNARPFPNFPNFRNQFLPPGAPSFNNIPSFPNFPNFANIR